MRLRERKRQAMVRKDGSHESTDLELLDLAIALEDTRLAGKMQVLTCSMCSSRCARRLSFSDTRSDTVCGSWDMCLPEAGSSMTMTMSRSKSSNGVGSDEIGGPTTIRGGVVAVAGGRRRGLAYVSC